MEAQFPPNWKGLNIDQYDITTDPDEHMDAYKRKMSLYTSDNSVLRDTQLVHKASPYHGELL